jgi:hypothetical protein
MARRPIEDLRFVVVGAYVADCIVRTPRMPVWGEEYEARSIGHDVLAALAREGIDASGVQRRAAARERRDHGLSLPG